jgi:hypothetical protein
VSHTTYDVRIALPDASEKWIRQNAKLRRLSQNQRVTSFAGVKFRGYSGISEVRVGCFASAAATGSPLPPIFSNQQLTRKIPQDLGVLRTYTEDIPDKGLRVSKSRIADCVRPIASGWRTRVSAASFDAHSGKHPSRRQGRWSQVEVIRDPVAGNSERRRQSLRRQFPLPPQVPVMARPPPRGDGASELAATPSLLPKKGQTRPGT